MWLRYECRKREVEKSRARVNRLFLGPFCDVGAVYDNKVGHHVRPAQLPFLPSTLASDDHWFVELWWP